MLARMDRLFGFAGLAAVSVAVLSALVGLEVPPTTCEGYQKNIFSDWECEQVEPCQSCINPTPLPWKPGSTRPVYSWCACAGGSLDEPVCCHVIRVWPGPVGPDSIPVSYTHLTLPTIYPV